MERRCCICGCCFATLKQIRRNHYFVQQVNVLFDIIIANGRITSFVCGRCKEIVGTMYEFYTHIEETQKLLLSVAVYQNQTYCRLCGCSYKNLTSLFQQPSLPRQIKKLFKVIVTIEDTLPTMICEPCQEIINNNLKFHEEVHNVQKMYFDELSDNVSVQIDPQHYTEISSILDNLPAIYGTRINESEEEDFQISLNLNNQQELEINTDHQDHEIETTLEHIKEEDLIQEQSLHNDNMEDLTESVVNDNNSTVNKGEKKDTSCSTELSKSEDVKLWSLVAIYSKIIIPERKFRSNSIDAGGMFKCICCKSLFKSTWEMFLHERIYFNKKYKALQCEKCARVFATKHCFAAHKSLHIKLGDFNCNQCSKSFLFKMDFENHMKAHRNGFPSTCPICEIDFSGTTELKIHGNTHSTTYLKKQYPFYCAVCGLGHFSRQRAGSHLLVHELKQDVSSITF